MHRSQTSSIINKPPRFIRGSTETNYIEWTNSQHLSPQIVTLPHWDTKAFWVGNPDAILTLLYFHGGGWGMPGSAGHFSLVSGFVSAATAAEKSLAVLVLQYDLAPAQRYPHQLIQCVELLRYAMTDLQNSPDQITLGGDSAGGTWCLEFFRTYCILIRQ
jgi:acetyl esterase/lipase